MATATIELDLETQGEGVHFTARSLVQLIARLKTQHRAGITPTFGQLGDLFDLSERLSGQLDGLIAAVTMATRPLCAAVEGCGEPGEHELVPGRVYCAAHARQVRAVLGGIAAGVR